MPSRSPGRHGTRRRDSRGMFKLIQAKGDRESGVTACLLIHNRKLHADALLSFHTTSLFHKLFQSWSSRLGAQPWPGVEACSHLHALLMALLLLQVPENEVGGCVQSWLHQHPGSSNTSKGEEK